MRLLGFSRLGFIHALFYRILIFVSIAYGFALAASLLVPLPGIIKAITTAVWILLAYQVFAVAKVFSMVSTSGAAFGSFSREYAQLLSEKNAAINSVYRLVPYAAIVAWAIFFIAMLVWWP